MKEGPIKDTVEGLVVNLGDCGHFVIMNDRGLEALHRMLKYFEGKKVRITIKEQEGWEPGGKGQDCVF